MIQGMNLLKVDFHRRKAGIFEAFWLHFSLLYFFRYLFTEKKGEESVRGEGREGTLGQHMLGSKMQKKKFFKTACSKTSPWSHTIINTQYYTERV